MSTQCKTNTMLDLKIYVKVVAAVFTVSSATAFAMVLLRLLKPELYYLEPLLGSDKAVHYLISGMMVATSAVGFFNSCVVLMRDAEQNEGSNMIKWLLLDSLFETCRVVYVFVGEAILKGHGPAQAYELVISGLQYLLDSFLYCEMILRH